MNQQTQCGLKNCSNPLPKEPFKVGYTIDKTDHEVIVCGECGVKILSHRGGYSISPEGELKETYLNRFV
jgi:hypothetical protein